MKTIKTLFNLVYVSGKWLMKWALIAIGTITAVWGVFALGLMFLNWSAYGDWPKEKFGYWPDYPCYWQDVILGVCNPDTSKDRWRPMTREELYGILDNPIYDLRNHWVFYPTIYRALFSIDKAERPDFYEINKYALPTRGNALNLVETRLKMLEAKNGSYYDTTVGSRPNRYPLVYRNFFSAENSDGQPSHVKRLYEIRDILIQDGIRSAP